jgi:hypothetical protein
MYFLHRRADKVLERAKARRDHMNRPHQQSDHMIGWPVYDDSIGYTSPRPFWLALVAIFAALLVYLNFYHHESAQQPAACVASK